MSEMARPPTPNAMIVPKVPASFSHTPVINTQLQPIMAPKDSAITSRPFSTLAKRGDSVFAVESASNISFSPMSGTVHHHRGNDGWAKPTVFIAGAVAVSLQWHDIQSGDH